MVIIELCSAYWYLISNIKELRTSLSDWLNTSLKMRSRNRHLPDC